MGMVSFGAKVSVNDGGGGSQQEFAEVQMINVPFYEATTPETTHLQTTDRQRTFIPGMLDPGVLSWEQLYSETDYARLVALINTAKTYVITDPQTSSPYTWSASGILRKVEVSFETRGDTSVPVIKAEVKLSGAITNA